MYKNINNIEFQVTEACNLKCTYCYLEPDQKIKENMSKNMSCDTFDHFFEKYIFSIEKIKKLKISFWGGEPLINFDFIMYIVKKFNTYINIKFSKIEYIIITNGTLINKKMLHSVKK